MLGYTVNIIAHQGGDGQGVHFIRKRFSVQRMTLKASEALDKD
jgi:hypothetical protein